MARLILFNKPHGVLSQFSGDERTLADFIALPGFYPAGRLDKDSEGLLLLTDDGRLQHHISHPSGKQWKTYWAQVEGVPDEVTLERLRTGVTLRDGPTRPARVRRIEPPRLWPRDPPVRFRKSVPDAWLEIAIGEGRNRQVRRMTAAVGLPTLRLVRIAVAEWSIGSLAPGAYRIMHVDQPRTKPGGEGPDAPGERHGHADARRRGPRR